MIGHDLLSYPSKIQDTVAGYKSAISIEIRHPSFGRLFQLLAPICSDFIGMSFFFRNSWQRKIGPASCLDLNPSRESIGHWPEESVS